MHIDGCIYRRIPVNVRNKPLKCQAKYSGGKKRISCRHQKLAFHVDLSHFTQNISPQVRRAENNNNAACRGRESERKEGNNKHL